IEFLESLDFDLIKVSLKAFDVPTTVEANRLVAQAMPYAIHLGITEAGPPGSGIVRSAIGIGILRYAGLGDTIRVSLPRPPKEEVPAGSAIMKSLNLEQRGPVLISCPTCGRCEVGLVELASQVEAQLKAWDKPIKVAVMGCVVNGPGEAREADVGIAGGKGRGSIFVKGKVVRTVEEKDFLSALMAEIEKL
ncbi:MAG: flavodoxin-dependent (E)-4-hydroxy-3-methylbut-2-enyl-diphosphate synthase, partial [Chloroflexota bacterium]